MVNHLALQAIFWSFRTKVSNFPADDWLLDCPEEIGRITAVTRAYNQRPMTGKIAEILREGDADAREQTGVHRWGEINSQHQGPGFVPHIRLCELPPESPEIRLAEY